MVNKFIGAAALWIVFSFVGQANAQIDTASLFEKDYDVYCSTITLDWYVEVTWVDGEYSEFGPYSKEQALSLYGQYLITPGVGDLKLTTDGQINTEYIGRYDTEGQAQAVINDLESEGCTAWMLEVTVLRWAQRRMNFDFPNIYSGPGR